MGEMLSSGFGSSGDGRINKSATAKKQAALDGGIANKFSQDYFSRFGGMNGYMKNLSGFYGGQDPQAIIQNYANVNAFHPVAKKVMQTQDSGGMNYDPLVGSLF